jgi:hypothetical protein
MVDRVNDGVTYYRAEVAAIDGSLLRLREDDGREWILNTACSYFVHAEEHQRASSEFWDNLRKRLDDAKAAVSDE